MKKLFLLVYSFGLSLYNYYRKKTNEMVDPQLVQGTLYREGLQYYLESPTGNKYALRMLDVHGQGINRVHIGTQFKSSVINDPGVITPEGFIAYCYRLEKI